MSFLYDQKGKRKYLTIDERRAFLEVAKNSEPEVYTFCMTLAYTGARISEVLALTAYQIDFSENLIVIECLKKRREGVYRSVPVPQKLLEMLENVHSVTQTQQNQTMAHARIWPWCRTTAWKKITALMADAGIAGSHACPKGLRHGFGVSAVQKAVPLNMVKKWLGHSRLSTTEIYADAMGEEEKEIAERLWVTFIK